MVCVFLLFPRFSDARRIGTIAALGWSSAHVVGHDWGGPVAFAHAAFHPGRVTRLAMLDTAVPGDGNGTFSQNGRRWHHAFHQTLDLPEELIAGRECMYCRWFYEYDGQVSGAITDEDVNENMRTYGRTDHTCKALLEFLA